MPLNIYTIICFTFILLPSNGHRPLVSIADESNEISSNNVRQDIAAEEKISSPGTHVVQMEGGTVFEEDENMFHPVELPTDFESYDIIIEDGYITLEELAEVTGARENIDMAFNASDRNGDGRLTRNEFKTAPWSLAFSADDEDAVSGSIDEEDYLDGKPRPHIDPEIKRYLLTEEELQDLEASREHQ